MIVRIAGVVLPSNKRVVIGLTYVYGIGKSRALDLCTRSGIGLARRVKDLTEHEVSQLRAVTDGINYPVEGDLRRFVSSNIKHLVDIGCYCGLRHRSRLPVHGQRTHTNARTSRGKSKAGTKSGASLRKK